MKPAPLTPQQEAATRDLVAQIEQLDQAQEERKLARGRRDVRRALKVGEIPPRSESNLVPDEPLDIPPGPQRVQPMQNRVMRGEQLWNPADERFAEEKPLAVVMMTANVTAEIDADGRTTLVTQPNRNGQNSEAATCSPIRVEARIDVVRLSVRKRRLLKRLRKSVSNQVEALGLAQRIWGCDAVAWSRDGLCTIAIFLNGRLQELATGSTWLEAFSSARRSH